jgi:transcriptional regulator with XRE-family HTH domain
MSLDSELLSNLETKTERDAFSASLARVAVPMQIRALRKQHGWNQDDLAKVLGAKQPWVSALETPGGNIPNLNTLLKVAAAFDVGLLVWFAPFSELVTRDHRFSPDDFVVPSYGEDVELRPASGGVIEFPRGGAETRAGQITQQGDEYGAGSAAHPAKQVQPSANSARSGAQWQSAPSLSFPADILHRQTPGAALGSANA